MKLKNILENVDYTNDKCFGTSYAVLSKCFSCGLRDECFLATYKKIDNIDNVLRKLMSGLDE